MQITYDEVAKHNKRQDLHVIIHNKVYNITAFLAEHPGGEEVLLDEAGGDATESFENVGHSEDARELLKKYCIGDLDLTSVPAKPVQKEPVKATVPSSTQSSSAPRGNALRVLLPLLFIVTYIYLRFILT